MKLIEIIIKEFVFKVTIAIILLAGLATLCPGSLSAGDLPGTRERRLTLAVYLGFSARSPAKDLEALMVSSGFGDNDGVGGNSVGKDHPYSLTGVNFQSGTPWMIATYYRFWRGFAVGAIFSQTQIGTTYGFMSDSPISSSFNISYSVSTFSPQFALQTHILHFGIGPAFYNPNTGTSTFRAEDLSNIDRKVGILADLSLAFPSKTRFFGEIKVQYRSIGQVEIGPWIKEGLVTTMLPAIAVSYDHWFFGLGFGIALH